MIQTPCLKHNHVSASVQCKWFGCCSVSQYSGWTVLSQFNTTSSSDALYSPSIKTTAEKMNSASRDSVVKHAHMKHWFVGPIETGSLKSKQALRHNTRDPLICHFLKHLVFSQFLWYFTNYWTNSRHVWTCLDAFLTAIRNTVLKLINFDIFWQFYDIFDLPSAHSRPRGERC